MFPLPREKSLQAIGADVEGAPRRHREVGNTRRTGLADRAVLNQDGPMKEDGRSPRWSRARTAILSVALILSVLGLAAAVIFLPGLIVAIDGGATDLTSARQALLFMAGGVIAIVTLFLTYRRDQTARGLLQLERDKEDRRAEEAETDRRATTERALRDRFATTVQLLSDPSPGNRKAALFAIGALADDWDALGKTDEVQVCIEVITGYLRAARSENMGFEKEVHELKGGESPLGRRTTPPEVSVNQAGFAVIRNHLQADAEHSWSSRTIDLAGAHIDYPVDLQRATIGAGGSITFEGSRIEMSVISLAGALVDGGTMSFARASVEGGTVDFLGAEMRGGEINATEVTLQHARLNLFHMELSGGARLKLFGSRLSGGASIDMDLVNIRDGAAVILDSARVGDGASVTLDEVQVESGGALILAGLVLEDGGSVGGLESIVFQGGVVVHPDGSGQRSHTP